MKLIKLRNPEFNASLSGTFFKRVFKLFIIAFFVLSMISGAQAKTAEEWYAVGFEQSIEGDRERAVRSYKQALLLKKDWPQAHHNLGLLYYQLKDGLKAVQHLSLAEKFYLKDSGAEANRNLRIVQKNLEKTFVELDINPVDFIESDSRQPFNRNPIWKKRGYGFSMGDYVFTISHNLKEGERVRISFEGQPPVPAKIVKRYIIYDLALLKIESGKLLPGLMFADSSVHQIGDLLALPDVSTQGSNKVSLMKGSIMGLNAIMRDKNIFELDFPSNSAPGTPLLNDAGQVVGMVLSTSQIVENFRAAGFPPKGSIALKSSYLKRIFSLYLNSLRGPQKGGRGKEKPASSSSTSTASWDSALAVIEGEAMSGDHP